MTSLLRTRVMLWLLMLCGAFVAGATAEDVIEIGSRRELFVDRHLIDRLADLDLELQPLRPAEPSKQPAMGGHYATVLHDGDIFRQYCRGERIEGVDWRTDGWAANHANELTLYAESDDGILWRRPDLGLYEVPHYPEGNVVLADHMLVTHNFTPTIDTRPGVPAEQRYKGMGGLSYPPENWGRWPSPDARQKLREQYGPGGLYAYVSADGVHWRRLVDEAVIPEDWGKFDSQNVAFWSTAEGQYVCYFRIFQSGHRAVARSTSPDFRNWTQPVVMKGRVEKEHLYTSGTHPYFRAPHIYIAPATWFLPGEDPNTRVILMTTRAGSDTYDRTFGQQQWLADPRAGNRTNYIAFTNGVQTGPKELSFYCLGKRYTLRLDGFAAVSAGEKAGRLLTKPLIFNGDRLSLNYAASDEGRILVEVADPSGEPLEGFSIDDCTALTGDEIDAIVQWTGKKSLADLAGRPVRLRFDLQRADLYALQFLDEGVPASRLPEGK